MSQDSQPVYTGDPGPNQLDRRLLGTAALNSFPGTVSASRQQMFSSHIGQNIVIAEPTAKSIQTGMEYEYGKYTFAIEMPENGRIIKIIDRYPAGYGAQSFKLNPERIVIYEGESGRFGMIQIKGFCSNHPYFGFEYKQHEGSSLLTIGNHVPKGTVFYDSPNKKPNGEYHYAREVNVAYMSHPSVSDDGIGVCRDVLDKYAFRTYERRVVEWGKDKFPLNLYGDDENFKIFPDIGEYVHPANEHQGLLMALRSYDEGLLMVDQSQIGLKSIDNYFDQCCYVDGAGGRVVDIQVYHQPPKGETLCDEMMVQVHKYRDAILRFRREVVQEYERLRKARGGKIELTPEFHRFVIESMAIINQPVTNMSGTLEKMFKLNPMDEYRVEFVIEYVKTPTIGYKQTDGMGGKGVITNVLEPHEMPVAANGMRTDILVDPGSNVNRMRYGNMYEQLLNCIKYDLRKELIQTLAIQNPELAKMEVTQKPQPAIQAALDRLKLYHSIVSPRQHRWLDQLPYPDQVNYLANCIQEKIIDYFPPENEVDLPAMVEELKKHFTVTKAPVTYVNKQGETITTEFPVLVGGVYIMLLEKIGAEWSSVAVSKTQQNGVITYVSGKDKYATPTKQQATRVLGETETRIICAYIGGDFAAELHDRSNNPNTRKEIVRNILKAPQPTNIDRVIDRQQYPLGYGQPLQIFNHILQCAGYQLAYQPYDPSQQTPKPEETYSDSHVEEL